MREKITEPERMTTFLFNVELLTKFKENCAKEGKSMKEMFQDFMIEHNKVHGDGNPAFLITDFIDPLFMACPAFYRDGSAWSKYLDKASPQELENVKQQIIMIDKKLGVHL